ncbi:2,3-diaminopropionate biosynthesis protein SbnA [Sorangium sp. So ce131]|uniref:2,3-diaminopropionate biosynthesis protein SbnA n=1 Tax=Sorangium sp. So ce131 TaxID=3133282 RepID=UPI003F5DA100
MIPSYSLTRNESHTAATHPELTARVRRLGRILRPTPLVQIWTKPISLFVKLEYANPFGSLKDRTAYGILLGAVERGDVGPSSTIVESSSGNFAIAMASLCRLVGLRFVAVVDPTISPLYLAQLKLLCHDVQMVTERDPTGGFLKSRLARVESLRASLPNVYWPNQYTNTDGADVHYRYTGAEICDALERLDYVFVPVSSSGTIVGVSRKVKERFPRAKIVAVDSHGSVIFGGEPKPRHIPGMGSSISPNLLQHALIDRVVHVEEADVAAACHHLLAEHGLFVGGSAGSTFSAVQREAPRIVSESSDAVVVFVCADRGAPYLTTVYDRAWNTQVFGGSP